MKTYTELGTAIGELVEQKNAAYGNSIAKAGAYLALLYPDGLQPSQYCDAVLLARDFDKSMRIANDHDAFGESPYEDKAGYAILGAHMQWQKKEERSRWQGNANGPDAPNSSVDGTPDSTAKSVSAKTGPTATARTGHEPLPQPDGCSAPFPAATAPSATEAASRVAGDPANWSRIERQRRMFDWCCRAFGETETRSIPQRGLRLLEEAAEAAQAAGVDVDTSIHLMVYVWGRKKGELAQELGGVAITSLALAAAANLDMDSAEVDEILRVLSKPLSHFKKRNEQKNADGLTAGDWSRR
jgi:NTP pyrophosphatase (non-canonical NTP hydrolase)